MIDKPSLLPPTSTGLERAAEQSLARLADIPINLPTILWDPWRCTEDQLSFMAWGLSIDAWDPSWPLTVRRQRVASAIMIQRSKGTVKSVRDVVASFGGSMDLREWWQHIPPTAPYTFDIIITIGGGFGAMPASYIDDIIAEVARTKPARAHFDVTQGLSSDAAIRLAATGRPINLTRIQANAL